MACYDRGAAAEAYQVAEGHVRHAAEEPEAQCQACPVPQLMRSVPVTYLIAMAVVSCVQHLSCIARNTSGSCSWQQLYCTSCSVDQIFSGADFNQGECIVL